MRSAYIETLSELAKKDKNVYAVISDNGAIVYDDFRASYADQFINAGISEANMVAMSAGMASRGKIPFAYTIGAFLAYRAYEFILNDVCMQNANVKLVGIGAGCSYSLLGSSHHSIYDLAVLRPLPNLTILSPASPMEVKNAVNAAYNINGPVYLRLGTNREKEIYEAPYDYKVGKAVILRDGDDIALISTGSIMADVMGAADILGDSGISVMVVNMHTISPLDTDSIVAAGEKCGKVLVIEEHSTIGGLGSAVAEVIARNMIKAKFDQIGINGYAQYYGKHDEVKRINGLGVDSIVNKAKEMIG